MPEPSQTPNKTTVQEPVKKDKTPQLDFGPQLTLPTNSVDSLNAQFKDWNNYNNIFANGIALPSDRTKAELERDHELQRSLSANSKTWEQLYPVLAPPSDGFGVKVGGTSIPLSSGLSVWDLRSSVIDGVNQHGDRVERGDRSEPGLGSQASQFGDRYDIKGPKFGLSWTMKF